MPKDKDVSPKNTIKSSLDSFKASIKNKIHQPTTGKYSSDLFTYGPPVSPKEFINSKEYLGNDEKGIVYPWVIDVMEEIFSGDCHFPKYTTAAIVAGKGSGKSYLAALVNSYMWYLILSFKSFSAFLKQKSNVSLDPTTTIQLVGMAKTAKQAKEIVFDSTGKFIYQIKAFKDRGWFPDSSVKSELVFNEPNPNEPSVTHKRLIVLPGNSSETFALGFAIFGGTIDEAAFFREKLDDPVSSIYSELDTRRQTRFQDNGLVMLISSARSDGDFIESFEAKAKTDPLIYFKRIATYDCKPEYAKMERFNLEVMHEKSDGTIEKMIITPPVVLKRFYEANKETALRDWNGLPSIAGDPFYKDFMLLMSKVNKDRKDPSPDKGMDIPEGPADILTALPPSFVGAATGNYKIHVDLAKGAMVKGQCGCGFAMTHKIADPALGFKIVVDLAIRFKVPAGKEVNINEILEFIRTLKDSRGFNITKVTFDQWNSLNPIQTINSWGNGIIADKLAVDYKEHVFLKTCFYSGQLDIFYDNNLMYELKRLEDFDGTLMAGVNSYKDESDAVAGAVYGAAELSETVEEPLKPRVAIGIRLGAPGAVRGAPAPTGIYRNNNGGTPKYWR